MELEEARKFFSTDLYAVETTGAVIEETGENFARCSVIIGERHMNANGGVMGGVMFTLADFALAVATNSPERHVVTMTSQISYFGGVKGKKLIAEARCLRDGRRTCSYIISVTDDLGNNIASVAATGMRV